MKNMVAAVNREIRKRGLSRDECQLVAGRGYYYFVGSKVAYVTHSVYVYRAASLPLDQWLSELDCALKGN